MRLLRVIFCLLKLYFLWIKCIHVVEPSYMLCLVFSEWTKFKTSFFYSGKQSHFDVGSEKLLTELNNSSYPFTFMDFQVDLCMDIPFYLQDTVSIFQQVFFKCWEWGRPLLLLLQCTTASPLSALEKCS